MSQPVAVWIDHKEAHIFHVEQKSFDESTLHAPHHVARHPKPETTGKHPEEERRFFHEVAHALEGAMEILVVGPSTAKLAFLRHVRAHHAGLEPRIIGVETVDHPTDRQLAAYVRTYFLKAGVTT